MKQTEIPFKVFLCITVLIIVYPFYSVIKAWRAKDRRIRIGFILACIAGFGSYTIGIIATPELIGESSLIVPLGMLALATLYAIGLIQFNRVMICADYNAGKYEDAPVTL